MLTAIFSRCSNLFGDPYSPAKTGVHVSYTRLGACFYFLAKQSVRVISTVYPPPPPPREESDMMSRYTHLLAMVALVFLMASGPAFAQTDYDSDNDNLIDVTSLLQLNAIRYDLDGDGARGSVSASDWTNYTTAFSNPATGMGCPATCTGYELMNNLDFDENSDGQITVADATYWNSGAGWMPIGNNTTKYTGTFHGNDNTISNLFIDRSAVSKTGLFGYAEGGTIRNLSLVNANVTGDAEVAVLVGEGNNLQLMHIHVTGQVSGLARSAGLVGRLAHGNSTITACRSEVNVIGRGNRLSDNISFGGMVGWNSGTITASYVTGAVSGQAYVGGLVGYHGNSGTPRAAIRASYATGTVSGNSAVGGMVGANFDQSTITGSYAIGPVSGATPSSVGGLVGTQAFGSSSSHSYYDSTTTGQNDTGKGIPQATSALQSPTGYTGIYATNWNLNLDGQTGNDEPWYFGATDQYPVLKYAGLDTTVQFRLQPASVTLALTPASISEDGGVSTVSATLAHPSNAATTITVSAQAVSPAVAGDFTLSSTATLTIAANATTSTGTVTITAVNNTTDAPDKRVTVSATVAGGNGALAPSAVTLTITDDDDAPSVQLTLSPSSISENGGVSTVTATLAHPSSEATTITVSPVTGGYTVGSDATIAIAAGNTTNASDTVVITAVNNGQIDASNRVVTVTGVASNDHGAGSVTGASLTLQDAGVSLPMVSISSPSVAEGSGSSLEFIVSLSAAGGQQVTVGYTDATTGTATSGTDYTAITDGTLTFAVGVTSRTITVSVTNDALDEDDETVIMTLRSPINAVFAGGRSTLTGTGTIRDNDEEPSLSIADASVTEVDDGDTASLEFIVTLSAVSGRQVTVGYTDAGTGTASSSTDYTAITDGTLTFAAGVTSDTLAVTVTGDDANEPNETVIVTLRNATNATISTTTGTGTINDNDASPTLSGLTLVAAKIVAPPANASYKNPATTYTSFSLGFTSLMPQTTSQLVTINNGPPSDGNSSYFHYVCADKDTRQVNPDGRTGCRQIGRLNHPTSITLTRAEVDFGGVMWHVWEGEGEVTVIREWIPIPVSDAAVTLTPTFSAGTTAYTGAIAQNRNSLRVTPTASSAASTISVSLNAGAATTVASASTHTLSSLSSGANTVSVTVTERSGSLPYTVTLSRGNSVPSFDTPVTTQTFTAGVSSEFQVPAATGGDGVLTYEATGLPAGLTFDADGSGSCTGARTICGTPTAGGTSSVTIYAVDADNDRTPADRGSLSFTINVRGVSISSTNPASLTESNLNSATVTLTLQHALFSSGVSASHFELVTAIPSVSITSLGAGAGGTTSAVLTLSFSGNFTTAQTLAVRVLAAGSNANSVLTTSTVTVSPSAGVTVSRSSLTLEEAPGGANANRGTYTVVLDAQPANNVVIGVSSNNSDVTLSSTSLTFTNGNWNTAQTVTVTAGQDTDDQDDTATVSHSVTTASGDYTTSLSIASVTVTVNDDDMLVRPTNVQVTALVDTLSVSWDAVTGATGYKVQWKSGSEVYNTTDRQASVTGVSHKIPDLTAGTTYTVRVIATRATFEDSEASDSATGVPKAPQPDAPTNVQVTALVDSLEVSWDAVTGATGYKVQWKSGSQAYNTTDRQTSVTGVSHKIPGLTGGTAYTVQVIATRTHADDSEASSEATGTPKPTLSGLALAVTTTKNPPANASYKNPATVYATFSIGFSTLLPQTTAQPVTITGPASDATNEYFHHVCANRDTRQGDPTGRTGCRQISILTHPTSITLTQAEVDSGGVMWHIYDEGSTATVMTAWISIPISESVTLMPSFASSIVNYTGNLPSITDSLHITPTASLGTATISVSINGGAANTVDSGDTHVISSLNRGANTVSVSVTESSQSTAYTVTLSRGNSVPSFGAGSVSDMTFTSGEGISGFRVPAATDGDGALTYEASGLPAGLTFDADGSGSCTGSLARSICGTPTAGGTFPVNIYAVDADDDRTPTDRASLSFTIKVAGVSISESSLTLNEDPGGSNANQGTYTVVLDIQPSSNVVIGVSSNNTDVILSSTSLTFTNGNWDSPQTVTVTANPDTDGLNDTASVTHRVTTASGSYRIGMSIASVSVTVNDDDEPALSIGSPSVVEGSGSSSLEFIVTLSIASSQQVTVDYADATTGTATSGTDYTAITDGTLTLAAGVTRDTIAVPVLADALDEDDETVIVTLSNASNATISTASGTGTITDDDDPPTLSIGSPSVDESDDTETASLEFIVTLSAASGKVVTVGYTDAGTGTATSGTDYTTITGGTLTLAAGVTRDTIAVTVTGDALDEENETVVVTLSSPTNATISTASGTGTITDDDDPPVVSIADASVAEGATGTTPSLEFIVSLSAVSGRQVTVDYADAGTGSATSGTDYTTIAAGTLTFAAGVTSDTLAVSVTGDGTNEPNETVIVRLSNPSNATLSGDGATLTGTGTITNDDGVPSLSISSPSVAEGSGSSSLEFVVTLNPASGQQVTVDYAETATGRTATPGVDYTALASGTLTIAAGVTRDTLAVSVTADALDEANETVVVELSNAVNAMISTATGTGTINDDDDEPTLSIADASVAEGATGATASLEFIVSLSAASGKVVTVVYAETATGRTATPGTDYTAITGGTLTLAAGVTRDTIAVTVRGDALDEENETVVVELSSPTNATISTASGTGTINDDDDEPSLSISSPSVAEGATGTTPSLEFIVTLSAASGKVVTVDYAETASGRTATPGTDYTAIAAGTLTLAAGVTRDTIAVSVTGDDTNEQNETVVVELSNAVNATISTATGTGTITNDDATLVVTLSLSPASISENGGVSTVSAKLSHPSSAATTITVRPLANAYTVGQDSTITIAAGDTTNASDTVAITAVDNGQYEVNRAVTVSGVARNDHGLGSVIGAALTLEDDDAPKMYWADYGTNKIQRADLDGSNVEDLITTGLNNPFGIALDVGGGKMYWTDYGTNKIQRADLDGSNVEDLISGLSRPYGIALDVGGGKMYWTDSRTSRIQRADLNGSNFENLITTGLRTPWAIALDVGGGKMYWTDSGTNKIQRADLDGSNVEDLITTGLDRPWGLALDVGGGKMYWMDQIPAKIQRADLDGSNVEDLITTGLSGIEAIALDVGGGKMYWTDSGTDKIQRADLNGSNVEDLITTGLTTPYGLALDKPTVTLALSPMSISEAGSVSTVSATLSHPSSDATTITVRPVTGAYTVGSDSTITIAAGDTTNASDTVVITAVNNTTDAPAKRLGVSGTVAGDDVASLASRTLTITDDDAAPDVRLSLSPASISENGGVSTVSATLSRPSSAATTITVRPLLGNTYTVAADSTIVIVAGDTTNASDTVVITAVDNAQDDEPNRIVLVSHWAVNDQGVGGLPYANLTLTDDDDPPTLSIGSPSVDESDATETASLEFIVTLSAVSGRQVTVDYAETATGRTATPGVDYTALDSGTLTFAAGVTSDTIAVSVTGDDANEPNETVIVTLSNPSNATISTATGTGTITNDDGVPTLSISSPTVTEGSGSSSLEFIVTLSAASGQQVTVDYAETATGRTATPGADYTAITGGTLTFAAGVTRDTLAVSVLADALDEENETVVVELSNAVNATISTATGTGTITDDDATPTLSIASASVAEGTTGATPSLEFIVSLSAVSGRQVTVDYADATSGTASSGTDYTAITSGTLTLAAGVTRDTLAVTVLGDVLDEDDETVIVTLSSASNATFSGGNATLTGTGTITDDDDPPVVSIADASVTEGDAGETPSLEFIVSLSAASGKVVTVDYVDATSGTASSGTDYTAITAGTLTLAAGVTSDTLAVSVTGDDANEPDETVVVTLSNPSNATFTGGATTLTGTGTITNDDGVPRLSISSPTVAEGSGSSSLEFVVTLNAASGLQVTVDYAETATGRTATPGADYTALASGTLTIAAGVTSDTLAVSVLADALDEDNETVIVELSNAVNAVISTATGTGTITDDDATPTLSIDSPSVAEGTTGATPSLEFIVSLSAVSGRQVTVDYADATSGTATSGTDYTEITSGTLTIAAGVTSDTLAVSVLGDVLDEENETVIVELSSASNATFSGGNATLTGTGTITDDDDEPTLSIADASVTEGDAGETPSLEFIVSLSAASGKVVTVGYADATSGTATSGTDYTAITSGTLTLAAGVTSDTLAVSVTGDDANEPDETVVVELSSAGNATFSGGGTTLTGTGTITNDDGVPRLSISSPTVTEGSGSSSLEFIVTLNEASGQQVTVDYEDAGSGTATSGDDYTAITAGTLTLAAGVTSDTLAVTVLGDALDEDDETVIVTLSSASNAAISTASGTGTITDDDATPTLSIADASVDEGTTGATPSLEFIVSLSAVSGRQVTVAYADATSGTATSGTDYTEITSGTLTIAAGVTSDTLAVSVLGDALDEDDETVIVTLSTPSNATFTGGGSTLTGTGTITDDDDEPTLSIADASVDESDDTETASLEFIVSLSAASTKVVTVGYEDAGTGTATSGTDYTAITAGTLTLAAGVTSDTLAVSVTGDDANEPNETVIVTLSSPSNATLSGGATTLTGTGTIRDDDQIDYDTDNDNLIDVTSLAQLNAIRYDLNGDGAVADSDTMNYNAAFPAAASGMGCPATCTGYELMNNLDFDSDNSGTVDANDHGGAYWNSGAGWTAIGVDASGAATVFSAIFDGNDNTISNLFINLSTSTATGGGFVGLFGNVTGTIRDVGLEDVNITNTRTGASDGRTGALAGRLSSGGTVRGSHVAGGSVTHTTSSTSTSHIGCLLGYSDGTVRDSYATCNLAGTNNYSLNIGGLIGKSDAGGTVDTTYATGTVTSTGTGIGLIAVGGLIGRNEGQISVSYATGNVSGDSRGVVGGLTGKMAGPSFANYATGNVSGSGTGTGATDVQSLNMGGLTGYIEIDSGEYLRASYATGNVSGSGTGVKAGGLIGRVMVNDANSISAVYAIGAVSSTSTGITDTGGLAGVQDGSATPMTNSYWDTQTTGQTTTAGTSSSTTGAQTTSALQSITDYTAGSIYADWNLNLDGQAGNDDPWYFGATNQYPVLKYAGLDTTAQFTLQPAIVTLALMPASISENGGVSTVTATLAHPSSEATTITVRPVAGAYTVGADSTIAIAAGQTANASDTVVITAVDNAQDEADRSVTVSGVAINDQGVGSVTGADLTLMDDDGAPTLSISSPSVAEGDDTETASLEFIVTLSAVSGQQVTVGYEDAGSGTATSGTDYTAITAGTLTLAAGVTSDTIAVTVRGDDAIELNETVVVELSNPVNATLTGEVTTLTGTGTITDDDGSGYDTDNDNLIDITTLAQLNAIRYDLDGDGAQGSVSASDWTNYTTAFPNAATGMGCPATCTGYELMNNLDFDSNGSGSVDAGDDYPNWTAIGVDASGAATVFSAIFDGNDNTISNLFINSSTSTATGGSFVGLFGDVSGTIRDVGLLDVNITNTRTATGTNFGRTGALAGKLSAGGTVRGSYIAGGSVTHTTGSGSFGYIGCLLGYSNGTISDSYATCNVVGTNNNVLNLGGLIGESDVSGSVDSTYATGTVTSSGPGSDVVTAGGLIGYSTVRVSVSYATGNVTATGRGRVGGLIGRMGGSSFANYATGNVSGSGTGTGATTIQSLKVGGLMGEINLDGGEYLRASYATGNVSGSGTGVKAGGLTGRVQVNDANSITAVYAIGAVSNTSTGTTATGGLAGEQGGSATPMTNSYWDTQTTGQTTTAGTSSSTTGAQTTSALQSITGYTVGSIYADWNLNLDGQAGNDDPWNFGATNQYPVLKYAGLDATAQFTLQPAVVTLALMPVSISENGGVSTVTATLAYPSSAATTITVRPVAGAYAVGADSTIAIAAGQMANASDTVVITAVDNAQDELDRSVTVSGMARNDQGVGSVTGADLTLTDDDAAPTVTMAVAPASILENGAISTVTATLSHPSSAATTITVSVTPVQPAVAGDYTLSTADTLIVAAGQTTSTGTVTITTVDNAVTSGNKTVTVSSTVGNSVGAGSVTDATLTIIDDEAAQVTLVLSPSSISENAEVSTITATLDRTVAVATTITVSAEAVSPAEASDFTLSGATTLTIAANVATSTGTVTITAVNNTTDAPDKRVTVSATVAGGNMAVLSSSETLTITDDDQAPDVTLVLTPSSISENAEVSTVSATLSHPSSAITTITVSAEAVSPATASDFTLSSADTLIIAASETTSTGTVTITAADNDARADEKTVTVSATANNTQGITAPAPVTLTITDDETPSANLDVDGDGRVRLFSDIILVIRYVLFFREEALLRGNVIEQQATRTTAQQIEPYLDILVNQNILDVDGDGDVRLFSDIILIIRYVLFFREDALVRGNVIEQQATRTTAQEIEPFIRSLYPDSHFE